MLLIFFTGTYVFGFSQLNSPYTRFGVGQLSAQSFANVLASGSCAAAFNSNYQLNFTNPASYGFLNKTTFNFGATGSSIKISNSDSSQTFGNGQLSYLALGFPVIKGKWGASFGLMPFSQVNYNLVKENDSTAETGASYNSYKGNGALYKFYVGSGYHWKNIAVGFNAEYLFGNITYTDLEIFSSDSINAFNTRKLETKSFGKIVFDGGIQINIPLKKNDDKTFKYNLTVGADANNKQSVNVTDRVLFDRFVYHTIATGFITPIYKDTIKIDTVKGIMVLPMHFDAGIRFQYEGHFAFAMNYSFGKWSDYSFLGTSDGTAVDYHRLSFGGEIVPKPESDNSYFNTIRYRAGFYTGQYYQQFYGIPLHETGVTFGAGLPFLYRTSYNTKVISEISLAFEFGVRGSTENNLLKENYFNGTVGFSLTDLWFVKRKFD